jgi:uncharacterized membrane protein YbhN (UPF0104 family)
MGAALRWTIGAALLVALIAWVQRSVGWGAVFAAWQHIPPADLVAIIALTFAGYVARAARIAVHFSGPLRESPLRCFRVMALHNVANNFLPMRTGELSFPLLLKREFGLAPSRSVGALLWLRALDLGAVFVAAAWSLGIDRLGWLAGGAIGLLGLILPAVVFRILSVTPVHGEGILARLASGLPVSGASMVQGQVLTLVHWGMKLAAWAWLLSSLGGIEPVLAWAGAVAGELTSVLPIHGIAGAGTYEAGVVLVLSPLGVATDSALIAAADLHLFLLGFSLLVAGLSWLFIRR